MTSFSRTPDNKLITDQEPEEGDGWSSGAYSDYPAAISPSGRYIVCGTYYDTTSLSDTSIPAKVWSRPLTYDIWLDALSQEFSGFTIKAVDDEGTIWGSITSSFKLLKVEPETQTPEVAYTWTEDDGTVEGARVLEVFTFTMPDDTILLLMLPQADSFANNPYYFTATKGVGTTLTSHSTDGTWAPVTAFQDDEGNAWIVGVPRVVGALTTMKALRITDVGTSTYPSTVQTFTMPAVDNGGGSVTVVGIHALLHSGAMVGAWIWEAATGVGTLAANYLFRAALDSSGSITLVDCTADPVIFPGVSNFDWNLGSAAFRQQFLPDPSRFFVQKLSNIASHPETFNHCYGRVFTELDLTDLSFGTDYDLDDWNADDIGDGARPEIVLTSAYIDNVHAFAGTRFTVDDPDFVYPYSQNTDLFLYYFGDEGEGSPAETPTRQGYVYAQKLARH